MVSGETAGAAPGVGGPPPDIIAVRSFPSELDSVRAARHFVTRLLGQGPGGRELTEDVAIVVTELAANAILHARSGFTLTISLSEATVRIAVRDDLSLVAEAEGRPFDVKAGHGLSVVAHIARQWSVEQRPDGKVVWAELPVKRALAPIRGKSSPPALECSA